MLVPGAGAGAVSWLRTWWRHVAAFLRTPLDDGTCPSITEMVVAAVPDEMRKSSLVLTSGQVLFPFEDSPQKNMMVSSYMAEVPHNEQWSIASSIRQNAFPLLGVQSA